MFDFGFGELLLLAVIALVVLGPERLPVAARMAGLWIRKARAQWNAVKAEMENELADEDLRRHLREASDAMRESTQEMRNLRDGVASTAAQMTRLPTSASSPTPAGPRPEAPPGPFVSAISSTLSEHASNEGDPAQMSLLDPEHDPARPPVDRPHSDG